MRAKTVQAEVEMPVVLTKFAIGCTVHHPGSIADVETICRDSRDHSEALKKYVREFDSDDNGLFKKHNGDFWAVRIYKTIGVQVICFRPHTLFEKLSVASPEVVSCITVKRTLRSWYLQETLRVSDMSLDCSSQQPHRNVSKYD